MVFADFFRGYTWPSSNSATEVWSHGTAGALFFAVSTLLHIHSHHSDITIGKLLIFVVFHHDNINVEDLESFVVVILDAGRRRVRWSHLVLMVWRDGNYWWKWFVIIIWTNGCFSIRSLNLNSLPIFQTRVLDNHSLTCSPSYLVFIYVSPCGGVQ